MTIRINAAKMRTPAEVPMDSSICCENAAFPVREIFTPGGGFELSTRLCRLFKRLVFAFSDSPSSTSTFTMVRRLDCV